MKWEGEVVEEVRGVREAYAARFDYDLKRIFEDLKKKEEQEPACRLANLNPVKPHKRTGVGHASSAGVTRRHSR